MSNTLTDYIVKDDDIFKCDACGKGLNDEGTEFCTYAFHLIPTVHMIRVRHRINVLERQLREAQEIINSYDRLH